MIAQTAKTPGYKPPVIKDSNVIHPKYGFGNDVSVTFQAAGVNKVNFKLFFIMGSPSCAMMPLEGSAFYNSNTNRWEGNAYSIYDGTKSPRGLIKFESVNNGQKLIVHDEKLDAKPGAGCGIPCVNTPCNVIN